jgi:Cu(I)/Ag(I) efflux system membrane fusion protein
MPRAAKAVSHQASGTLEAIDQKGGTVTVTHAPVASLNWPAMTMDFILANPALVDKVKAGAPSASSSSSAGRASG